MKLLFVIDMQNDFLTGSLANKTKQGETVVKNVVDEINNVDKNTLVIATRDSHFGNYFETQEGKNLPIAHCIMNSEGWQINEDVEKALAKTSQHVYVDKTSFGYAFWDNELDRWAFRYNLDIEGIEEIELVGVCTDICIISNALILKALLPEVPVKVKASCCAGLTEAKHEAALEVMRSCQIEII